jgi:hypothetical protein
VRQDTLFVGTGDIETVQEYRTVLLAGVQRTPNDPQTDYFVRRHPKVAGRLRSCAALKIWAGPSGMGKAQSSKAVTCNP